MGPAAPANRITPEFSILGILFIPDVGYNSR
jgi:hypothetical protein